GDRAGGARRHVVPGNREHPGNSGRYGDEPPGAGASEARGEPGRGAATRESRKVSDRLELNDELLCAYMDGERDAEMRARVERAWVDAAGARVGLEGTRAGEERLRAEIPLPAWGPNDPLSARILEGTRGPRASQPPLRFGAVIAAL